MKLTLRVAYPGEAERRFRLSERVIVGSSSNCAISLPDSGMLAEHFSVRPDSGGAKVRLANGAPAMGYNGAPFQGGLVPYDADFYVGQIRFAVSMEAQGGGGQGGPSPVIIILAIVAVAAAAIAIFAPKDDDRGAALVSMKLPSVFGPAACHAEAGKVAYAAADAERAAISKRQRAVFDPHDGVDAGRLYSEAEACYGLAGDAAGQARTRAAGQTWREKILADAAASRVRLEVALSEQQEFTALAEVRSLLRLFEGEKDPAIDELKRQELRLAYIISKKDK